MVDCIRSDPNATRLLSQPVAQNVGAFDDGVMTSSSSGLGSEKQVAFAGTANHIAYAISIVAPSYNGRSLFAADAPWELLRRTCIAHGLSERAESMQRDLLMHILSGECANFENRHLNSACAQIAGSSEAR